MISRALRANYPYGATSEEVAAVFSERLRTLADATCKATWGDPLPIAWRTGWKATVAYRGRDKDGSLLVTITCTGPGLNRPYVRNVRMVKQHRLSLNQS